MTNETWKQHPDFPYHEVSTQGRIRTAVKIGQYGREAGSILKGTVTRKCYIQMRLKYNLTEHKLCWIHRLVLETFIGPASTNEHQAAHNNGVSHDNRLENLRWATPSENQADRILHGTDNRGERNPMYIHGKYANGQH